MQKNGSEPLDATVTAVWSDRLINVAVIDIYAKVWDKRSVMLLQDDDLKPDGRFCEWMPFQTGQAAKAARPDAAQLQNRYSHHPPKGDQAERYIMIRNKVMETADVIVSLSPISPEQSRALDALDNAMMLANAAIARNE